MYISNPQLWQVRGIQPTVILGAKRESQLGHFIKPNMKLQLIKSQGIINSPMAIANGTPSNNSNAVPTGGKAQRIRLTMRMPPTEGQNMFAITL